MKCDWCEKEVEEVRLFFVRYHLTFPKKLNSFCKDCCNKKNLGWSEPK